MRKLYLWLLLPLLLTACAESASSPVIEIESLLLNEEGENYARKPASLPALSPGDEVTLVLRLNGNGENLNTFVVKTDEISALKFDFGTLDTAVFSEDKEFTNVSKGLLGFKDGVGRNTLTMKVAVQHLVPEAIVNFYLFSKAVDCAGAKYALPLSFETE